MTLLTIYHYLPGLESLVMTQMGVFHQLPRAATTGWPLRDLCTSRSWSQPNFLFQFPLLFFTLALCFPLGTPIAVYCFFFFFLFFFFPLFLLLYIAEFDLATSQGTSNCFVLWCAGLFRLQVFLLRNRLRQRKKSHIFKWKRTFRLSRRQSP